jgi:hypothetical protein
LKVNDLDYWRFIEGEWLRLLKVNDSDFP